jgi:hypothetical protein
MANADRRFTYRLDLAEDRVRLHAPSAGRVVVLDLSASGSGLIVSPDDFTRVSAEPATFEFGSGLSFSVKLDPVRVTKLDQQLRVGARFQDLPVDGMRVLSQFLIRAFLEENSAIGRLLDDPRTLTTRNATFIRRQLRRSLLSERRPLRVYAHGNVLPIDILAERLVDVRGKMLIETRPTEAGLEEGGLYAFVVAQPGSVTHFTAHVEHRVGTTLYIALPEELHQAGFRDSIRTGVESDARATVAFAHPRLPDGAITRPLIDLSARGFAFESDPESDLLFPGDRLDSIEIRFPDKVYRAQGTIRGIAPHRGTALHSCGVEIVAFADSFQEHHWRERAFRHAHPRVALAEAGSGAERVWNVLEHSGYVSLWTPESRAEDLRDKFHRFWGDAQPDVGKLLLLETQGTSVATMAGNLLFPRTWLIHHFGVDKTHRASPVAFISFAREMYAALMYVLQHVAPLEYFVIYVEKDKRWTQALYADFVERYASAEDSQYDELRVFKCCPTEPRTMRILRGGPVDVVPADETTLKAFARHLSSVLAPIEIDAFAYGEEEIDLASFGNRCREQNYERARHVYFAHEAGVPVAALIAESGDEGANLFGLMNRCRLLALGPGGITPLARQALLATARTHYTDLGKHAFVYLGDAKEDIEELDQLGYDFVSEGVRWLARRRLVPAWLSFVQSSLAS